MTITLPPALDRLVQEQVQSGLYASESELISEALRRAFAPDAVQEWVRTQAAEGFARLDAGEYEDLTRDNVLSRLAQRRASASCA